MKNNKAKYYKSGPHMCRHANKRFTVLSVYADAVHVGFSLPSSEREWEEVGEQEWTAHNCAAMDKFHWLVN